jgi:hypothetical protein
MQTKKELISFVSIGILLLLTWLFFLFSQTILEDRNASNIEFVPSDARVVVRLETKEIAKHALFSVFLETTDSALIQQFENRLNSSNSQQKLAQKLGIDYLSDFIYFELPMQGELVGGLLLHVKDQETFQANIPKDRRKVSAVKNNIGVYLFSKPTSKLTPADLKKRATEIVSTKNDKPFSRLSSAKGMKNQWFHAYFKDIKLTRDTHIKQGSCHLKVDGNRLFLSGNARISSTNPRKEKTQFQRISPKGLHLSTHLIPDNFNDTLNTLLRPFGISLPAFRHVSINYFGTKIGTQPAGIFVIPQMELIVSFKDETAIQSLLQTPNLKEHFKYVTHSNYLELYGEKLYFKQLTPKSFYIGTSDPRRLHVINSSSLLHLKGSLKALTTIEGDGIFAAFLEMLPIYRASQELSLQAKSLDLQVNISGKNKLQLSGNLTFNPGYSATNELIRFLLTSQLVD